MTNSRNKGAAFEREVAKELFLLTGISLKRDLDQYRASDLGDLICDDPAFPFVCECKRYANGGFQSAWWSQAYKAALAVNKRAAVIYRFDRQPIRVRVQLRAAMECISRRNWSAEDQHMIDMDLEGFAYLIREGMA
ncbi:hypothetical protein PVV74_17225 [Roseovarius sp. SK2]|uniref:putative PDDEXK endonuclease n=1 Tax=Roseovarius TaxID=74030 RepID=UPI00237B182F|nr:hypothetical protein [Roseovarius sp. SK2]MDD9727205.1 hypothetical protein [Roseovarius sp. SK2]